MKNMETRPKKYAEKSSVYADVFKGMVLAWGDP
jgi:hypothetical protein